ncbi:AMP-binding protein [Azospirillum sp.]|uniref:AMP-binding protein n=1 Tax=Azospirillum sp. TaxID=34012 RepID=UPI002D6980DE|nr:AMP-binding protein [Azospirillum sp.]HYD70090.1 AMP-binding protein [Azospirillum sp.]
MFRSDRPQERTVHAVLRARAEGPGDRPFLIFGEQTFTHRDLWDFSARAAAGLQALGLNKGDTVAVMMGNRPEFLALWFGSGMIGAIEVPVNTAHRGDLLAHMLDIADCGVAVADAEFVPALLAVAGRLPRLKHLVVAGEPPAGPAAGLAVHRLDDLMANGGGYRDPGVTWSDPYAVMFTSGTTGPSKGAVMPHHYAVRMGELIAQATGYGADDCLYNALPLFHGNAQVLSTMPALLSGARMVLAEKFSATRFWDDVRRHGCTEFNYIGTILSVLMKADPSPADRDHPLRLMMGAGAGPGLFEAFEARFCVTLVEGYGMSEIGLPLMSTRDRRKPGSCGVPTEDYDVRLVDDDGLEVADGTPGELLIRPRKPHAMMLEYRRMPDKTVEAWRDLWFHTGDVLARDADGFYRFVDRRKDAIRRRGENISSFEVERTVNAHPAVQESAALPVPSDLGEDEVMVCVVPKAGAALAPEELIAHCRANMAAFMVPRYVRVLAELPKTPTQRVEKYRLRAEGVTADTWDREEAEARA